MLYDELLQEMIASQAIPTDDFGTTKISQRKRRFTLCRLHTCCTRLGLKT